MKFSLVAGHRKHIHV